MKWQRTTLRSPRCRGLLFIRLGGPHNLRDNEFGSRNWCVAMEPTQRTGYDITVRLADEPGTLAALGEVLGEAGVNIDGICGVPCEGFGLLHILVQDPELTREVLQRAGFTLEQARQVLLLDIIDRPGELGGIARRLADADLNINLLYLTASMDLVIGVDQLDLAAQLLSTSTEP